MSFFIWVGRLASHCGLCCCQDPVLYCWAFPSSVFWLGQTGHPSIHEAEGWRVQGQPGLHGRTLSLKGLGMDGWIFFFRLRAGTLRNMNQNQDLTWRSSGQSSHHHTRLLIDRGRSWAHHLVFFVMPSLVHYCPYKVPNTVAHSTAASVPLHL